MSLKVGLLPSRDPDNPVFKQIDITGEIHFLSLFGQIFGIFGLWMIFGLMKRKKLECLEIF